jgi:hypothetical protein
MTLSLGRLLAAGRRAAREALDDRLDRPFLGEPASDTDLFLVAFPKSGLTWTSRLFANANLLLSGDDREVTFFNLSDFVPDIHHVRRVGPAPLRAPGFRCFKSHASWLRRYRKVIYLVRDPRHVMASYHMHLASRGVWQGTLEAMVRHEVYGIRAWVAHVGGWLDNVDTTAAFTLLRYEDLSAHTAEELTRLYALLGWRLAPALAAEAVERASPARMRADEARCNEGHPRLRGTEFVRHTAMKGPRQPLTLPVLRHILAEAEPLMRRLGYLPGGDAA